MNGIAKEIGLPSSSVTNWKQGKTPRAETIKKIADYFNVSVDYLTGNSDIKEKPTAGAMSFEDIKRAVKSMSREELIELAIAIAQEQGER